MNPLLIPDLELDSRIFEKVQQINIKDENLEGNKINTNLSDKFKEHEDFCKSFYKS